jgi:hypothetical protein
VPLAVVPDVRKVDATDEIKRNGHYDKDLGVFVFSTVFEMCFGRLDISICFASLQLRLVFLSFFV